MADEEEVEIVEEGAYVPKKKPELDEETRQLLKQRGTPDFVRQQAELYRRLDRNWRRPRGIHSKMRKGRSCKRPSAKIGYGTAQKVKGLHPSGFKEVLVHNPGEVDDVDPATEAIRIAGTVGGRKRKHIIEKADEMDIRVLNRGT
ncbi:MAG: 50S ribosomal protein L32e [Thermoplasmatota archaeon]